MEAAPSPKPADTEGEIPAAVIWRRAAAVSLLAIGVIGSVVALAYRQDRQHRAALLHREGDHVVSLEREFLTRELGSVRSDLRFLAQEPLLQRLHAGDPDDRRTVEREYEAFSRSKPLYDQIRFIDRSGQEVVRVNRRGDDVEVVDEADLQSKAARYYFREAVDLRAGEVFVSPFDLNVERGAIERPPKPVIRLVAPVVDESEVHHGVVVLNYAGARLLDKLREVAAGARGEMMLVNRQGQYLQAPDPSREWGWLLGSSASFADDYPAAWERIRGADRSQARMGDDLFTAQWIPLAEGPRAARSAVAVVSHISVRDGTEAYIGTGRSMLALATLATIFAVAYFWARATLARRAQERLVRESEARLRALTMRLLAAQEEERKSMSRILHDELGQQVTAIALDLRAALQGRPDPATEPTLRRAVEETEGVLSSLHEIATRVRPSVLDDLGLVDAIESFASEFEQRTGIRVELDVRLPSVEPSDSVAENIYRIIQEALSNVSAHAGVREVRVRLVGASGNLDLCVEDGGCGFDATRLNRSNRLGILGMRERVELLGGEFALETAPGRGTRIHARLPLPVG